MTDPRLDRRLDRLIEFDPRSRNFPIRELFRAEEVEDPIRSYTWSVPVVLDQGSEGACVGFAWAQEIAARPWADPKITDTYAQAIYYWARQHDEWPGEDYNGTSVLAGAKAVSEWLDRIKEYRWAFGLDDAKRAVAYKGPGVAGSYWWTGMFQPDSSGRIRPTGIREGGHAYLVPRVTGPRYKVKSVRNRVYVYNSWGRSGGWPWAWMSDDDFEFLLHDDGEFCIPVLRR